MNADQGGEDRVVSFQEWNAVLGAEPMSQEVKALYRKEIVSFLHHCKVHHAGASIMRGEEYQPDDGWQEGNAKPRAEGRMQSEEGGTRRLKADNLTTESTDGEEGTEG